jgi:uroporphyrinogen-III synthase
MKSGASPQKPALAVSPLAGCSVVITRPAGTATTLARQVRRLGGVPVLLPGLSLRAAPDKAVALAHWREALQDEVLIFSSPAAVRYALALAPCVTRAEVIAIGKGTARALHRHGIDAQVPAARQDSEGVLQLPSMQQLAGKPVALITAPGGRGLLQEELVARGASLREVHVYGRGAPRLNRRHLDAVLHLPAAACVLLSSGEAIQHLMVRLPDEARQRLCQATAIVSSDRIAEQARLAGFKQLHVAASANPADLLATAMKVCSHPHH